MTDKIKPFPLVKASRQRVTIDIASDLAAKLLTAEEMAAIRRGEEVKISKRVQSWIDSL